MLGAKVEKLGDMEPIIKRCRQLLPPLVKEEHALPYLGPALDAGMAACLPKTDRSGSLS
jgi:acetyl-CoA synthase